MKLGGLQKFFCARRERLGVAASQFRDTPMLQERIRVSIFVQCPLWSRNHTHQNREQGTNFSLQQKWPAYVTCKTQEQGAKPFACINLPEDSSSSWTFAMFSIINKCVCVWMELALYSSWLKGPNVMCAPIPIHSIRSKHDETGAFISSVKMQIICPLIEEKNMAFHSLVGRHGRP